MVDWRVVLGAFCGGIALTCLMAAADSARHAAYSRIAALGLMALLAGGAALGVCFFSRAGDGRETPAATITAVRPAHYYEPVATMAPPAVSRHFPLEPPATITALPAAVSATPTPTAWSARLIIPSLNVDSPVIDIPLHNGEWDISGLELAVGRLETTGRQPGDTPAPVLVGHMTVSAAVHGPFAYLQKIKKGATVVYRIGGTDYFYRVTDKRRVAPDAVDRLYLADGNSILLLTCTDWDAEQRTYTRRLLVRAELVQ